MKKIYQKNLYDSLKLNEYRLGTFRILPKLHKKKFSIRPIINYKKHVTSNLCSLIDFIVRPFI